MPPEGMQWTGAAWAPVGSAPACASTVSAKEATHDRSRHVNDPRAQQQVQPAPVPDEDEQDVIPAWTAHSGPSYRSPSGSASEEPDDFDMLDLPTSVLQAHDAGHQMRGAAGGAMSELIKAEATGSRKSTGSQPGSRKSAGRDSGRSSGRKGSGTAPRAAHFSGCLSLALLAPSHPPPRSQARWTRTRSNSWSEAPSATDEATAAARAASVELCCAAPAALLSMIRLPLRKACREEGGVCM